MRCSRHVPRNGEKGIAFRILVRKSQGKKPLGRPRHRWKNNIKLDLREDGIAWTGFIWLRIGTSEGLL
jgi:hypothetical protein